ncbi:lytic transglycosylase domain-containing protein [Paenibacillus puerhi]|uniref:lytic transglycosylase domain-containing protein n=1 Tax=Paenibacillus puerhi TaxID=2692622 RepID=UPI00135AF9EB|nr:lytic transglycosylase domain-containing protein [Paenibacillus puerhi]
MVDRSNSGRADRGALRDHFFPLLFIGGGSIGYGFLGGAISPLGEREIPAEYVPIYKAAEARYGVPRNLLAAHHRVETVFSTLQPMISSVGAEGHMQFMPCTWVGWSHPSCYGAGRGSFTEEEKTSLAMIARYGGYGVDADRDGRANMWSLWDSIFSAANFLAKNGAATGNLERAIFAYNYDQNYVAEVMMYARLYATEGFIPIEVIEPSESGFARPVPGVVTSPFGIRINPVTGKPGGRISRRHRFCLPGGTAHSGVQSW